MESKEQQFEQMGIVCPENNSDCGYGKCIIKGTKTEAIVIDVVPHIHQIDDSIGINSQNVTNEYFMEQLEECKKQPTVLNIFFEAIIGTPLSYSFADNPTGLIQKAQSAGILNEVISELQFKYILIKNCQKKNKMYKDVIINFIAVPDQELMNAYLDEIEPIMIKLKEILPDIDLILTMELIRDIEVSLRSNSDQIYISPQTAKDLPLENLSTIIGIVVKEIKKLKGSLIMESREYLTILSILKYVNKEKLRPDFVHKYFLVFGLQHQFFKWNNVDFTKITKYKTTVKFIRNSLLDSVIEDNQNPYDKVCDNFIRLKS